MHAVLPLPRPVPERVVAAVDAAHAASRRLQRTGDSLHRADAWDTWQALDAVVRHARTALELTPSDAPWAPFLEEQLLAVVAKADAGRAQASPEANRHEPVAVLGRELSAALLGPHGVTHGMPAVKRALTGEALSEAGGWTADGLTVGDVGRVAQGALSLLEGTLPGQAAVPRLREVLAKVAATEPGVPVRRVRAFEGMSRQVVAHDRRALPEAVDIFERLSKLLARSHRLTGLPAGETADRLLEEISARAGRLRAKLTGLAGDERYAIALEEMVALAKAPAGAEPSEVGRALVAVAYPAAERASLEVVPAMNRRIKTNGTLSDEEQGLFDRVVQARRALTRASPRRA